MENSVLKNSAIVSGVGETKFGVLPGTSSVDFGVWALREALKDSGLAKADIDGLIVMRIADNVRFGEASGLYPRWSLAFPGAGRWTGPAIAAAADAIAAGRARHVALIYGNDGKSAGATYGGVGDPYGGGPLWAPYGMTSPGAFHALMYSRYMAETGATPSHLAEVSIAFREHARKNPAAVMQKKLTADDHANARKIAAPLCLLDYCLINDGGVAMILSHPDYAENCTKPPVWLRATGQALHPTEASFPPKDYWRKAMSSASKECFERAELSQKDISGLMIYDNFTPTVLFSLEGFGYCEPGTAWKEIQDGRLRLGGEWQANTCGGHLSESYMQGWNLNVEAVRQLRGECGERQMQNPEFIHVMTASPQCSSLIYGAHK